MAELEVTASFLYWTTIRSLVGEARFFGGNVKMYEGPGWIYRNFIIKGDTATIIAIKRSLWWLSQKTNSSINTIDKT